VQKVELLECTLRDGSYVVDFQFSVQETAELSAGLQQAGFRRIEIGHGLGLGASTMGHGRAAATDAEYLEAARDAAPEALIGMFFIPGIGTRSDIAEAKKRGLDFIRVGTNVSETDTGEEYVKFAKDVGLEVSFNFMKSYSKSPGEFVKIAEKARQWGADVLTVVDSAGGMLPNEVTAYVNLVSELTGAKVGFHGHNNLDLAIANNIAALEAGASVVDCSLQGIGRSAGNAQTETMVLVLEKMGVDTGIDAFLTMDLGEKYIKPKMHEYHGKTPIDVTSGYALFHSSFLKEILKAVKEFDVDPRELIIEVSDREKERPRPALIWEVARKIAARERKVKRVRYPRAIPPEDTAT